MHFTLCPSSFDEVSRRHAKTRGVNFIKKLFGAPNLKSPRQLGIGMLDHFKHDVDATPSPPGSISQSASGTNWKKPSLLKKRTPTKTRPMARRRSSLDIKVSLRDSGNSTRPKRQISTRNPAVRRGSKQMTRHQIVQDLSSTLSSLNLDGLEDFNCESLSNEHDTQEDENPGGVQDLECKSPTNEHKTQVEGCPALTRRLTEKSISSTLSESSLAPPLPKIDDDGVFSTHTPVPAPYDTKINDKPSSLLPIPALRRNINMVKRKPVPYHILHGLDLTDFLSAPSTPSPPPLYKLT